MTKNNSKSTAKTTSQPTINHLLTGRVAIITGGTRGIGFATARAFLAQGAQVIIFGSREDSVAQAQKHLAQDGYDVDGYWPNLSDYDAITDTLAQIHQKYGHIDILVNNAGVAASQPIEQTALDDFEALTNLNYLAVFRLCKAIVPYFKEQKHGVILNTSSMVGTYGQPAGVGYPASKFAVNGLTKSLARELAPFNIRVNAVAPGIINTDMVAKLPESTIQPLINSIPLRRIGQPEDVANAFLFLASDLASYITGDILAVDGAARS